MYIVVLVWNMSWQYISTIKGSFFRVDRGSFEMVRKEVVKCIFFWFPMSNLILWCEEITVRDHLSLFGHEKARIAVTFLNYENLESGISICWIQLYAGFLCADIILMLGCKDWCM